MNEMRMTVAPVPEGLKSASDDDKRAFVKSLLQNIFVDDEDAEYTETPDDEEVSQKNTLDDQELSAETNTETL